MLLDGVEKPVRLRVEPPRVQREDAEGPPGQVRVLDERDVLGAAKGDADAVAEGLEGEVDDLEGAGAVELGGQGVVVDGGLLWGRCGGGGVWGGGGVGVGGVEVKRGKVRGGGCKRKSAASFYR